MLSILLAAATLLPLQIQPSPLQPSATLGGRPLKRPPPVAQEDCNGNGIPDLVEIDYGLAQDCQGDGIPDECQLAVERTYRHDDGISETPYGWGTLHYGWMTQYVVEPGYETITEIELGRGELPADTVVTVGLWSDPDGNLDPADARILTAFETTLVWEAGQNLLRLDVPATWVGPAGTSFFVGVMGTFELVDRPMAADFSTASNKSWIISAASPIPPDDLFSVATDISFLTNADWQLRAISCPSGHCGELQDVDFDGTPDACQVQDCNGNAIPDDQDIALGFSMDCQGDGIPDECQVDPGTVVYSYAEELRNAVGTDHDYYAWLSPFVVQPGGEIITDVEVAWGYMIPGNEVTICLWSDPNGDGDPTDAQLIAGYPVLSSYEGSGQWVGINIPDTFVGPAGSSFFLGAYGFFEWDLQLPTWFAAGFDDSSPDPKAWFVSADAPIDLNDLSAGAAEYGRLNTVCSCDGDWTIRAITCGTGHCLESGDLNANLEPDECEPDCNGNGVPDDLDIVLGTETDCDGNGIPDACDGLVDCDGNGLPDLCQAVTPMGLAGEYYAAANLGGEPVARVDEQVDFDFSLTAPPEGVPLGGFSARWTGSIRTTAPGIHGFSLLHQGAVRLWVNGKLLIDEWYDAGPGLIDSANTIQLNGVAEYQLRLEYQDPGGGQLQLRWQPPGSLMQPALPTDLRPIYDRNNDGVPDTCQLVADCNGNLVEDLDDIAEGTSLDCDGNLVPDDCQRCEDKDGNGWLDACELGSGPGLIGQYYILDPQTLAFGTRTEARLDAQVDFDWGAGSPTGVPVDRFGARWTGTLTTPAVSGSYAFHLQADDGARLWLDEALLIDAWNVPGTSSASVALAASSAHLLRVEYRETGGNALVALRWTVPGGVEETVPASALAPDTDLDGDGYPDLAKTDCNQNGIADALDPDVNGNCIPDDCEGGAGYWRFEEAGGVTILDDSPSGLHGTLNPYPTRVTVVPVAVVPQTGQADLQSLFNNFIGAARVPDVGGVLSVPNNSFTLEAWVQLDVLGITTVNGRQWLFAKKPPTSSDVLLEYALLVQAGNLGTTGRELAFRYGDGTAVSVVVSSLSINDYGWHFVSVAYDADRRELRFGVDGVFETLPFEKPAIANVGTLFMGVHENAAGSENQWLYGSYDEVRFSRAFLPPELLLDYSP